MRVAADWGADPFTLTAAPLFPYHRTCQALATADCCQWAMQHASSSCLRRCQPTNWAQLHQAPHSLCCCSLPRAAASFARMAAW